MESAIKRPSKKPGPFFFWELGFEGPFRFTCTDPGYVPPLIREMNGSSIYLRLGIGLYPR